MKLRRTVGGISLAASVCLGAATVTTGPAAAAPRPVPTCGAGLASSAAATLARTMPVGRTAQERAAWAAKSLAERQRLIEGFNAAVAPAACRAVANLAAKPPVPDGAAAWRDIVSGKAKPHQSGKALRFSKAAPAPAIRPLLTGQDQDGDGLDDGLESDVGDSFTPFYAVSGGEQGGTGFATFGDFVPQTVQQVFGPVPPFSYFRVQPLGVGSAGGVPVGVLRIDYLTLWNRDDGLDIGGYCVGGLVLTLGLIGLGAAVFLDGLASHPLDNERSAALVAAPLVDGGYNPDPAAYSAYSYYTAAHEGTFTDHSAYLFPGQPVPAGNHLILALSRSKHATYSFNPDGMPLMPGSIIDAVFSTIDFLYAIGDIDFETYLFYLAIASDVFYGCIIEHWQNQGGWYADSRVNVGEPNQPINGSHFIQDGELYNKLSTPLW